MFHAIFKSRRGSLEIHSVKFGIGSSLLDNLDRNSMEHISFIRIIYYECSVVFEHCVFPETVFFLYISISFIVLLMYYFGMLVESLLLLSGRLELKLPTSVYRKITSPFTCR